jgi:hypothetical protein
MYVEQEITVEKSVDACFEEELRKTSEYPKFCELRTDTSACKTPVSFATAELSLYVQCRQIIKAADAFNSGLNW